MTTESFSHPILSALPFASFFYFETVAVCVDYSFNPRTQEAEAGGLKVQDQPRLGVRFCVSKSLLKRKKEQQSLVIILHLDTAQENLPVQSLNSLWSPVVAYSHAPEMRPLRAH